VEEVVRTGEAGSSVDFLHFGSHSLKRSKNSLFCFRHTQQMYLMREIINIIIIHDKSIFIQNINIKVTFS